MNYTPSIMNYANAFNDEALLQDRPAFVGLFHRRDLTKSDHSFESPQDLSYLLACYRVATMSRIDKIIGLLCRISSL